MKTYHKCDYCHFLSENKAEIIDHERACEISTKLNGIGIPLTVKNIEVMISRNLLNLDELNHMVVEDEAFGHPGRVQLWICPIVDKCPKYKPHTCGHDKPHGKIDSCKSMLSGCPACVEVKK